MLLRLAPQWIGDEPAMQHESAQDVIWYERLRENILQVRAEIAGACRRAARDPSDVRLIAVTKYVPLEVVAALVKLGVTDIGESRPQQLSARAEQVGTPDLTWPDQGAEQPTAPAPRWHLIGHLQRNKARQVLPWTRIIHSVDSARLLQALDRHARELNAAVDVLLEVNIAGEGNKDGVAPADLDPLVDAANAHANVRLRGLMTMAPFDLDPESARPYFAALRDLLARLRNRDDVDDGCCHLSMGMSQDYVVAVEEGATLVRVGSALFEGLPTRDPR